MSLLYIYSATNQQQMRVATYTLGKFPITRPISNREVGLAWPLHQFRSTIWPNTLGITSLFLLPTDDFFELCHEFAVAQEAASLNNQSSKIHNILGKQIKKFEEFIIGLAVIQKLLHTLEECGVIYSLGGLWEWRWNVR